MTPSNKTTPNVKATPPLSNVVTPAVIVGLLTLVVVALAVPPGRSEGTMDIRAFGEIPVLGDGGRVLPVDTFARTSLMSINNKQEYTDADGKPQPATKWLLDILARGLEEQYLQQFLPVAPEVRQWLGLKDRPAGMYAVGEIEQAWGGKKAEIMKLADQDPGRMSETERKVLTLVKQISQPVRWAAEIDDHLTKAKIDPTKVKVFRVENDQLLKLLGLEMREGLRYTASEIAGKSSFKTFINQVARAKDLPPKEQSLLDVKAIELYRHMQTHFQLAQLAGVSLVPVDGAQHGWMTLGEALQDAKASDEKPVRQMEEIIRAYGQGEVEKFNTKVKVYLAASRDRFPGEASRAGLETWYNQFAPFYVSTWLCVVIFVLVCVSWIGWEVPLWRAAFGVALLTLLLQTAAIILRMYLQGRPPVTNLYSSAVWIGWGCMVMGLVLEGMFPRGFGLALAAVLGFPALLISHHLALGGDTLEMMQAVLDTNFWLATHVVTVTLGYSATFVAGALGCVLVLLAVIASVAKGVGGTGPVLTRDLNRTLGHMIYGVTCFALLLSFVGTVLGGIWADQSWGRFWGWDPKENGAVLIVIMNALILHARWAGLVKERGMAVLAMAGNMITMWSWFGTNQLGIGLHAYGFNNALVQMCRWFWILQGAWIVVGLLPLAGWKVAPDRPAGLPRGSDKPAPAAAPRPRKGERGSTAIVGAG